ncbi:Oidioi.mRNA.OKI2018_I69.PAR.g8695.t1.cds [Oikopleura dioica]|uniref:Oidioi.mRNA.OKI2018_I69.PAR.g8695.t1.cds n=1 Tax=Oikopleura dioica TaxID=34765 RepID=A0ABN7RPQ7_OIKDI|nr:Oidioi.mRNA.OKI2018_I69.PAR.g8695.t1.cds [Oikopleura dioica]
MQPGQQPIVMNIQQNAGPQYAPPPPQQPNYGYPTQAQAAPAPAPVVIQKNKQGGTFCCICCVLVVLVIIVIGAIAGTRGSSALQHKNICEMGPTYDLTLPIVLEEPETNLDNYESNKDCQVDIQVQDKQISIEFEEFEVEGSYGSCPFDYLQIGNETFCGTVHAGTDSILVGDSELTRYTEYDTHQKNLTFRWVTDGVANYRGFQAILRHQTPKPQNPSFFSSFRSLLAERVGSRQPEQ